MSQQPVKQTYGGFWKRTMTLFAGLRVRVVQGDHSVVVGSVENVSDVDATLKLADGSTQLVDLGDIREVSQVF